MNNQSEHASQLNDSIGLEQTGRHQPPEPLQELKVLQLGLIVEGGITVLALILSYFGLFNWDESLREINWETWKVAWVWGTIGTLPLLVYLAVMHYCPPPFLQPMRKFVDEQMRPMFARCSLFELLLISLSAGLCEELFFRWCLQGGIASWVGSLSGVWIGLVIASVIFGMCHWVNWSYGVTTIIVGAYLGWLMISSGTFLAPAISHALFDFIALVYVGRYVPKPTASLV